MEAGRRGAGFALKTFKRLAILRQRFGKELQRHKPTKLGVLGLVDHTHPAAAELLQNAIVGN